MLQSTPEDYDLDGDATIAHACDTPAPEGFEEYWQSLAEELDAIRPTTLGILEPGLNELVLHSLRHVRVAGLLSLPPGPVEAVQICLHGYQPDPLDSGVAESWGHNGVALLQWRVRGFPPSTIDVDDLRTQWILNKIEMADAWIMRGAVADVAVAIRWARTTYPEAPLYLRGESFGGGLAVLGQSLARRLGLVADRLVLGLPSLGDWQWRHGRYCRGAGGEVNMWLDSLRADQDGVWQSLLLFDAAIHARSIDTQTLAKLAKQDDVVPAPAAAAVYNALGGPKHKYVVPYGHFDGGLANARAHLEFERLAMRFLDPAKAHAQVTHRDPDA